MIGRVVPTALPQPAGVIENGELGELLTKCLCGWEVPDTEQLLLQRPDEPLRPLPDRLEGFPAAGAGRGMGSDQLARANVGGDEDIGSAFAVRLRVLFRD